MSEVDIPLLRKAVEWAEAEAARGDEGLWDQESWMTGSVGGMLEGNIYQEVTCGTSYCVAGWVCQAAGDKFVHNAEHHGMRDSGDTAYPFQSLAPNGNVQFIGNRAQQLLGIGEKDADMLFDDSNSIEDIRRFAESIAGEKL